MEILNFWGLIVIPIIAVFLGAFLNSRATLKEKRYNLRIELYILYRDIDEILKKIKNNIVYEDETKFSLKESNWKNTLGQLNLHTKFNKLSLVEVSIIIDFMEAYILKSEQNELESMYKKLDEENKINTLQKSLDKIYMFISQKDFKKIQIESYKKIEIQKKKNRKKMHDEAVKNIKKIEEHGTKLSSYDQENLDSTYRANEDINKKIENAEYQSECYEYSYDSLKEQYKKRNKYFDYNE